MWFGDNVQGNSQRLFDFRMMPMHSISANSFLAMVSFSSDKRRALVDQLFRRNVCFLYSFRYTSNDIINVCFNNAIDNAHSIIGGKISYLRDKLNVNFYEVGLRESLKKIDVLFKITHRISIQIFNLKTYYLSVLETEPLII